MKQVKSAGLVFLVVLCEVSLCFSVEVSIPNGKITGSSGLKTRHGKNIHSFLAIPYAQPHVGDLRFKDPQPALPWNGTLQALHDGPECSQISVLYNGESEPPVTGQEDCLHLNVYSPKVDASAKLPVMVYIHGGGYLQGSKSHIKLKAGARSTSQRSC